MQHVVDFIATLVVAWSAAALAHFGVTLKPACPCPHAQAVAVVRRLPGAVAGQVRATTVAEHRPSRVRIVLTLT